MEYVTNKLVGEVAGEINTGMIRWLASHALIKAQAKDYVRESQIRLILAPIADHMLAALGSVESERQLKKILSRLRETRPPQADYAAGNILNLLVQLQCDLHSFDFSHLTVRQAYLRDIILSDVNFAYANLEECVFTDTFSTIFSLAFNPDGEWLAAGTANHDVRLWKVTSGIPLLTLQGHSDWVWSVTFDPEGKIIASGSSDQAVRLWDSTTGQCLRILQGHSSWVYTVAFSPDGSLIASGSTDQTVRIWDAQTGQCFKSFQGGTNLVWVITFSPNGRLVANAGVEPTISIWQMYTEQRIKVLQGHSKQVRSITFTAC